MFTLISSVGLEKVATGIINKVAALMKIYSTENILGLSDLVTIMRWPRWLLSELYNCSLYSVRDKSGQVEYTKSYSP